MCVVSGRKSQFFTVVSPIYPFVSQLMLATKQVDLASMGIRGFDWCVCSKTGTAAS